MATAYMVDPARWAPPTPPSAPLVNLVEAVQQGRMPLEYLVALVGTERARRELAALGRVQVATDYN